MNRLFVIAFLCAPGLTAQPRFSSPVVGLARDAHQQLRVVHGVPGTFIWHDAIGTKVSDWAFDGSGGLVKTATELLTVAADGTIISRRPAPQRGTVLGPQSAFFPETAELWLAGPKGETKVPLDLEAIAGSVMALGPVRAHSLQLAACRGGALWVLVIDSRNGEITHETAAGGLLAAQACRLAGSKPLILLSDRMVLATQHAVVVQTTAGTERTIPIAGSRAVRAGDQWIAIENGGAPGQLIRLSSDGEKSYELPAVKEPL